MCTINLEDKLKEVVVSFTDACLYGSEKKVVLHQKDRVANVIYVSTRDYSYVQYMGELYNTLMGTKEDFFKIPRNDRKTLYKLHEKNHDHIKYCKRHSIWE